jgi:hypothetical protein
MRAEYMIDSLHSLHSLLRASTTQAPRLQNPNARYLHIAVISSFSLSLCKHKRERYVPSAACGP